MAPCLRRSARTSPPSERCVFPPSPSVLRAAGLRLPSSFSRARMRPWLFPPPPSHKNGSGSCSDGVMLVSRRVQRRGPKRPNEQASKLLLRLFSALCADTALVVRRAAGSVRGVEGGARERKVCVDPALPCECASTICEIWHRSVSGLFSTSCARCSHLLDLCTRLELLQVQVVYCAPSAQHLRSVSRFQGGAPLHVRLWTEPSLSHSWGQLSSFLAAVRSCPVPAH
ncbi:hypothetical protein EJ04DRAFT_363904 [Polyplosphaeria fusca]|uniref:Uncharacterized protein n=1 Tax=Polyplosphaeria fusca TaxID=682080 RepID=A0A9P4QQ56_9PLEO|nr:hypothetical protein EJ04DRAFT_363904 [Polyplosphaeria fusca]